MKLNLVHPDVYKNHLVEKLSTKFMPNKQLLLIFDHQRLRIGMKSSYCAICVADINEMAVIKPGVRNKSLTYHFCKRNFTSLQCSFHCHILQKPGHFCNLVTHCFTIAMFVRYL